MPNPVAHARDSNFKAAFPEVRHARVKRVGYGVKFCIQAASMAGRAQHGEYSTRLAACSRSVRRA